MIEISEITRRWDSMEYVQIQKAKQLNAEIVNSEHEILECQKNIALKKKNGLSEEAIRQDKERLNTLQELYKKLSKLQQTRDLRISKRF